jgi:hypothetical protein
MSDIGYYKYKHYIITIIPLDIYIITDYLRLLKIYDKYYCKSFEIINIEDVAGNIYDKIDEKNNNYEINKIFDKTIRYYLTKDIAFNFNFLEKKQYLLIPGGYSGYYKNYRNGDLIEEYFHINGKKNGNYKKYHYNQEIEIDTYYVDNKLNGSYTSYHDNGNIYEICYYQNNIRIGEYKKYDMNNNLTCRIFFNNDGTIKR